MHKLEVHSKLRCSTASSLIKTSQKPLKTYPNMSKSYQQQFTHVKICTHSLFVHDNYTHDTNKTIK